MKWWNTNILNCVPSRKAIWDSIWAIYCESILVAHAQCEVMFRRAPYVRTCIYSYTDWCFQHSHIVNPIQSLFLNQEQVTRWLLFHHWILLGFTVEEAMSNFTASGAAEFPHFDSHVLTLIALMHGITSQEASKQKATEMWMHWLSYELEESQHAKADLAGMQSLAGRSCLPVWTMLPI